MKEKGGSRRLKNYLLGSTIGKGSFGKVVKAIHLPTNQYVAIKVFNTNYPRTPEQTARILKQAEIMKLIDHPNIIRLYESIQTNRHLYLVMQYADKGDLFQHIVTNRKLSLIQARRIFLQLLLAVQYLQKLGITHRDLKPENILLDQHLNVKLCDFGFSALFSKEERLRTPCGSLYYSAPEMIFQDEYDPLKTDVWSLGVILYTMVCGYLPFQSSDIQQFYQKVERCQYQIPKSMVDRDLKRLLSSIFVRNPVQRCSLSRILNHQFLSEEKVLRFEVRKQKPVIKQLIERMNGMGSNVLREIQENRHTASTTHYWLLLKRQLRKQKKTVFDVLTQRSMRKSQCFEYGGEEQSADPVRKQRVHSASQSVKSNRSLKIPPKSSGTRSKSTDSNQQNKLSTPKLKPSPPNLKRKKALTIKRRTKTIDSCNPLRSMASMIRQQYQINI